MEEQMIRPERKRRRRGILLWMAGILAAAAGIGYLLLGYNRFSLDLELIGQPRMAVEYGESYVEPGCRVILRGTKFLREGMELAVETQTAGQVNAGKPGKYSLGYRARFLGMEASAGRTVRIVDTQCPEITLVPDPADLKAAPVYQEAGFSAWDNVDGDITDRVVRTEEEGKITYSVVDSSGNPSYVEREIPIWDVNPPEITLLGGETVTISLGTEYVEPGYTAIDRADGDVTDKVIAQLEQEAIARYQPGNYTIRYTVSDSDGNEASAVRNLIVEPCARPNVIYPKGKTIYLTFDDGPCPDTGRLLDVLKRCNVKATFFVVDTGYPEMMRRIVNEGHSIGVHTKTHNYHEIYTDIDAYFEDALGMQKIILDTTGTETWLLRFPGGSSNTISRFNKGIMTTLTKAVEDMGFAYFDWNVDSCDAGGANTSAQVLANVKQGISRQGISVVLQHDIHSCSVDAVESIIRWGQANGYTFLPLQTDSPPIRHAVQN